MEKVNSEVLPPCRVCGAPATGLHYGVISCEACKAFYRRSLARGDIYECPEERDCKISSESRNNCAYCRYQKCIKTGMSKDAIKTGRYTHAMKASTTREVTGLKSYAAKDSKTISETCLEASSCLHSSDHCNTVLLSDNDSIIDNRKTEDVRLTMQNSVESYAVKRPTSDASEFNKPFSYSSGLNEGSMVYSDTGSDSISSNIIEELLSLNALNFFDPDSECSICIDRNKSRNSSGGQCNSYTFSSYYENDRNTDSFNVSGTDLESCKSNSAAECCRPLENENNIMGAVTRCPASEQKLYDVSKIEIYDRVIGQMCEKHKAIVADDVNIGESLSQTEQEYLEMIELKKNIFGPLEPMSTEEYMNFYKETGLDIDGRREMLLEYLPLFELNVQRHINFAKTIPGFRKLSLQDQIGLIKGSRMEFFMFATHRCFNMEHKLYSPFVGKVFHLDDLKKLEGEYLEPTFFMQQKIKSLNLSREETVIISAFSIMATDYCDLEDPVRVEYSRDFLLECLFYLFYKQRPPGEKGRFIRIVECLTEMRNVREITIKKEEEFFNIWCNSIDFPPLLCEVMP